MFNSCDLNANQNEGNDDEPSPPPGLSRLVTGQTVSFDDGSNSPPFDRVIPGEGRDYLAPYQAFPPPSKTNTSGNHLYNNNLHNSSSHDFFDNYLRNSNANDNETKVNQPAKNKYGNHFFPGHDVEKRETYFHNDVSRVPPTLFDKVSNKNANNPFNNFHNVSSGPPPPNKPVLKVVENVQYDNSPQQCVPANKPENITQYENNFFVPQHDKELVVENKEKVNFFPQHNFNMNTENGAKSEIKNHNPSSNRMAIEGSSDNVSHSKAVASSTPISSPSYDNWYSNSNSHLKESRQTKEQNNFYGNMYAGEKPNNLQNNPLPQLMMAFNNMGMSQNPQDAVNLHSKTPSVSSNNSSNNETFGYQHPDNYLPPKRNDHFSNVETLENNSSSSLHDVQTNNTKTNVESTIESRQLPKLDVNRENYKNVDEDEREVVQRSDSDERSSISPRMVEGYTYNTIPGPQKNLDKNSKLNKQYLFDASRSKASKIEPSLDQRMVEGKTSNDTPAAQLVSRVRDDRHYDDDQSRPSSRMPRRTGADSVSGRSDKNRKKLSHNSRQDRRKIESDDEDYDESADRNYDYSPDREFRSYRGKHYRGSSPQRYNKSLSRRHGESSFTHSQDESYYDDDDDDYFDRGRNSRRYNNDSGRRPPRDRHYYGGRNEKYRMPEYPYYRYEVDSYYPHINSRPSSRSGSEYRSLEYSHQHSKKLPPCYEYLDPRRFPHCDGLNAQEMKKWLEIREKNPRAYTDWFRYTFPQEYEYWYRTYYEKSKLITSDSHQPDRRGSGHSGQSSINDDNLGVNDGKIRVNEQSLFKPVESKMTTKLHEIRNSPAKFTIPHVKGVFNALGQLIVVNACSPQDGQPTQVDVCQLTQPNDDPDLTEFMNFTGPFILGETHVNNVADFLKYHASIASTFSEKLLYLLIDLIITLRGVTDGIAISDLLTKSYENQNPNVTFMNGSSNVSTNLSEIEKHDKYYKFVRQGDKHSALAWAFNQKLWNHAYHLAKEIGTKAMDKFEAESLSVISMKDPLNTFYQFISKKIPLAMTACADEKWGDWRPHLAIMLSNLTDDEEFNKTAIVTLGDSLAHRDVFASHFCYLVAQIDFELPNKPSSKISLISLRNNIDHFGVNTSNHAILLTQAYEFAKRLLHKDYTISSLLPYKYLLATRLIDYGKTNVALQYLESVALDLIKNPSNQNLDLVYNVLELSEQIKFVDLKPLVADSSAEMQWLTNLRNAIKDHIDKSSNALYSNQYSNSELPYSDQSYQQNFSSQPLTQSLPLIHSLTPQHQPMYSSASDVQPSVVMFPTSAVNQQVTSLSAPNQNQSWENNAYSRDPLDFRPGSGPPEGHSIQNPYPYQPIPNNPPSFNVNNADYNQTTNPEAEVNYSPWDQPAQNASISMHSRNNYFEDPDNRTAANDSNTQNRKTPSQTSQSAPKAPEKSTQENKSESGSSGGWFNSLFKRKNQAILPDDKNKSIVFDREKNRWVDLNEKDDDNSNSIKPPPKASEVQTFQPMSNEQPDRNNEISPMSNTQQFVDPNRFPVSNVKNGGYTLRKGMKSNYVNVLSNSTVNAPASGMPLQPNPMMNTSNAQVPPNMNFYTHPSLDSGSSSIGENVGNSRLSENVPQSRSMNQEMPIFFNPAQYKPVG